jgi:hypothetical protein
MPRGACTAGCWPACRATPRSGSSSPGTAPCYRARGFDTPALIPQVYLHYDPYTRRANMPLTRQRMDFLLLLPHRRRVVIELDGIHHYADGRQRADPAATPRWWPRTAPCN